jgi:kynurenine formamidase
MKKIIDITGIIEEGMWNYPDPFPNVKISPLPPVPWVKGPVYCEVFEGIHSQTGTYLETPAHFYGNDKSYLLIDVPVEKLVDIPCVVLDLGMWEMDSKAGRRGITVADLESCSNVAEIAEGDTILLSTGWGRYWKHPAYLELGPFITKPAMDWLIAKKPYILGGDTARWENLEKLEGIFPDFYGADILMLGPLVELEKVKASRCRLTVLPLKVPRTSCAPCRAIISED